MQSNVRSCVLLKQKILQRWRRNETITLLEKQPYKWAKAVYVDQMLKRSIALSMARAAMDTYLARLLILRNLACLSALPRSSQSNRSLLCSGIYEGAALANAGRPQQCSARCSAAGVQISALRTSKLRPELWHHPPAS